jgi:hypothetical protein
MEVLVMKPRISLLSAIFLILSMPLASSLLSACKHEKTAADTIEPVVKYFESRPANEVVAPDLNSIEGAKGMILTWKVNGSNDAQPVEYSWVLAKNTDALMKSLIMFDSARAWNTEAYIFLPVSVPAVEIHEKAGLSVPKSIFDEDGMNRIREIVISGKAPTGSFVDQVEKFMD